MISLNHRQPKLQQTQWAHEYLAGLAITDPELALDVVAYLLTTNRAYERRAAALEYALRQGGSKWMVIENDDFHALTERVDSSMVDAFEQATSTNDPASDHLRQGWIAAFGRSPNGTSAYDHAVKSVEAALSPVVAPKNSKSTLGTDIRDMTDGASKFELDPGDPTDIEPFITTCKHLWQGQFRHGDANKLATHTVEEGVAAIQLAVLLVGLVHSGAFRRIA